MCLERACTRPRACGTTGVWVWTCQHFFCKLALPLSPAGTAWHWCRRLHRVRVGQWHHRLLAPCSQANAGAMCPGVPQCHRLPCAMSCKILRHVMQFIAPCHANYEKLMGGRTCKTKGALLTLAATAPQTRRVQCAAPQHRARRTQCNPTLILSTRPAHAHARSVLDRNSSIFRLASP